MMEIEANERLLSTMSLLAHDLREPLRKVSTFTQLLAEDYGDSLDEEGKQFVALAVDGANRAQAMITDLRVFAEIGTKPCCPKTIDYAVFVEELQHHLSAQLVNCDGRLTIEGSLESVHVDESNLFMVLDELVSNSIKFRSEYRPQIRIRIEADGTCLRFTVSDNGIGIPEEHREAIFDPMRRLNARSEYPGSGMGLPIAQRRTEHMGGTLEVAPAGEEGTTVIVRLPNSR